MGNNKRMTNVVDLTTKKALEELKLEGPTIQEQMIADLSTKTYQELIVLGKEVGSNKIHFYAAGGTPQDLLWLLSSASTQLLESQNHYE